MSEQIDPLLTELEELSARAVEATAAADTIAARDLIARRGVLLQRLQTALDQAGPVSYTEWNRLVVLHFQGNRMCANLETARGAIAAEWLDSMRNHALLGCISGVVNRLPAKRLNDHG